MNQFESHQRTRRPVKDDGQLMLGLGASLPLPRLPEPNRSQCIALLGRMLLEAIEVRPCRKSKHQTNHER